MPLSLVREKGEEGGGKGAPRFSRERRLFNTRLSRSRGKEKRKKKEGKGEKKGERKVCLSRPWLLFCALLRKKKEKKRKKKGNEGKGKGNLKEVTVPGPSLTTGGKELPASFMSSRGKGRGGRGGEKGKARGVFLGRGLCFPISLPHRPLSFLLSFPPSLREKKGRRKKGGGKHSSEKASCSFRGFMALPFAAIFLEKKRKKGGKGGKRGNGKGERSMASMDLSRPPFSGGKGGGKGEGK